MAGILDGKKQFHLLTDKSDIGKYVILCGDPARVEKIAAHFEKAEKISQNREFTVYTGYLDGIKISAASTGIGGPSAAICVEELVKCGAHTFIRVGTSGGMRRDVVAGDLVIASAAIRDDGTSREYMPLSYPAVADFSVVSALAKSAGEICGKTPGDSYHVGVIQSKDSFYGETNPETMAVSDMLTEKWNAYNKLGCLASEMECAAIFSVCLTRGVRAGGIVLAIWNVEQSAEDLDSKVVLDTQKAVRCAVGAMRELIKKDKEAAKTASNNGFCVPATFQTV